PLVVVVEELVGNPKLGSGHRYPVAAVACSLEAEAQLGEVQDSLIDLLALRREDVRWVLDDLEWVLHDFTSRAILLGFAGQHVLFLQGLVHVHGTQHVLSRTPLSSALAGQKDRIELPGCADYLLAGWAGGLDLVDGSAPRSLGRGALYTTGLRVSSQGPAPHVVDLHRGRHVDSRVHPVGGR